jgi:hypothetical protein
MLLVPYASKKAMKETIGQKLRHTETSMFGMEYKRDGVLTVAHRPYVDIGDGGREFFARVTMSDGRITKVE